MNQRSLIFYSNRSVFFLACSRETNVKQGLYDDWFFFEAGSDDGNIASVPGCIHTDLLDNGIIEDPFYRDNEGKLQWIGEKDWRYLMAFEVDAALFRKDNIILNFDGLDTYVYVFLNDSLIIQADNMFIKWTADVKSFIQPNNNSLRLEFHAPENIIQDLESEYSVKLPDNRAFIRKSSLYVWLGLGPKFITMGIWRDVYLEGWDDFKIENVYNILEKSFR